MKKPIFRKVHLRSGLNNKVTLCLHPSIGLPHLKITTDPDKVTCKKCLSEMRKKNEEKSEYW